MATIGNIHFGSFATEYVLSDDSVLWVAHQIPEQKPDHWIVCSQFHDGECVNLPIEDLQEALQFFTVQSCSGEYEAVSIKGNNHDRPIRQWGTGFNYIVD